MHIHFQIIFMCVYLYVHNINNIKYKNIRTHIYVTQHLFGMRLITMNHLTALNYINTLFTV